jgi:uncharacterized lipoprotein YmbA
MVKTMRSPYLVAADIVAADVRRRIYSNAYRVRLLTSAATSLVFVALAATSCSVLKPKADSTRFYVLRARPSAPQAGLATARTIPEIRLGPSRLAGYLEAKPIAVQDGPDRLKYLDAHHWAEPLPKSIGRVIGEILSQGLGNARITVYPDPAVESSGYEIRYTVNRFEGPIDGPVTLDVSWQLFERPSNKILLSAHPAYEIPTEGKTGVDAYVDRLAKALGKWGNEMAQAIRTQPGVR